MPSATPPASSSPRGAPLSPLFHGRVRLLVLSALMRRGTLSFTDLRSALDLTDGTLSVHLTKLEAGGVVEIIKGFEGKRPKTVVRLTRSGKAGFRRYVAELQSIVPGLA